MLLSKARCRAQKRPGAVLVPCAPRVLEDAVGDGVLEDAVGDVFKQGVETLRRVVRVFVTHVSRECLLLGSRGCLGSLHGDVMDIQRRGDLTGSQVCVRSKGETDLKVTF